ncbi:hypothetical protein N0V90_004524 [Kalmusia sp. IMI 367209]|nr:hypothetical protein N0V90_004524 [Kalmusia sp. IMI 367209]
MQKPLLSALSTGQRNQQSANSSTALHKVMISYTIEATLIIVYLLAHYFAPTTQSTSSQSTKQWHFDLRSRIGTATASSIHSLYATAIILSYAIVTAAITIFFLHYLTASLVDIYMNELLILAPAFSVFPVLTLHTLLPDEKLKPAERRTAGWEARTGFRRFLGAALYLFCLVSVWLIYVKGVRTTDPEFELGEPTQNLDINLSRDVYIIAPRYVLALVILILVVPLLGITIFGGRLWLRRRAGRSQRGASIQEQRLRNATSSGQQTSSQRIRNLLNFILQAFSVAMMLIQLTWLWYLRTEAMRDAGGFDRDTEWNFGQILAVGTWLPVLMEFVYFFLLSSHLSNIEVGGTNAMVP